VASQDTPSAELTPAARSRAKSATRRPPAASLSADEARAVALRAQGFGAAWSGEPIAVLDHLGAIQLDSVNVLARSHELVPFSRVGPTSLAAIQRSIYTEKRGFEYWGHAASWLPIELYRFFLPRMAFFRERWLYRRHEHGDLHQVVLDRIRAEGPLTGTDFEDPRGQRGTWWDWKPAKVVLEQLFAAGELMCLSRTVGFARRYELPERVLPPGLDLSDPGRAEAARQLLWRAVVALGIGTGPELADYYRLRPEEWRPALRELIASGEIVEVAVEGWPAPGWAAPAALSGRLTSPEHRPVLLSPFDNLVWVRDRVERLFGFHYRIEIYVPEPKRRFGYYVLPLLVRSRLAGRVDLKLDRSAGVLRVRGIWLDGASPDEAASALRDLATHLGARSIRIERVEPADQSDELAQLVGE
jgi:uncharacterized protein YcaQ